jgi:hypothetical protein
MDFIKKNYEKVLLGIVLLGLVAAVTFMLFKIGGDKQKLEDLRNSFIRRPTKALTNLDLALPEKTLKRVAIPALVDFANTNRVFNPLAWVKTPDGKLIPSQKAGPTAVVASNITALYLRLTLESVNASADGTLKYIVGVERQAAPRASDRNKKSSLVKLNEKTDLFKLVDLKGPPDNPTNIVLELNDTGDKITVSKEQPFKRVDGYQADLKYPPQNKNWPAQRMGDKLNINGENYKIVVINQNEVVMSAPNEKKWTIRATPRPE